MNATISCIYTPLTLIDPKRWVQVIIKGGYLILNNSKRIKALEIFNHHGISLNILFPDPKCSLPSRSVTQINGTYNILNYDALWRPFVRQRRMKILKGPTERKRHQMPFVRRHHPHRNEDQIQSSFLSLALQIIIIIPPLKWHGFPSSRGYWVDTWIKFSPNGIGCKYLPVYFMSHTQHVHNSL